MVYFITWLRLCLFYWLESDLEVRALFTLFGWIANLCCSYFAGFSNVIFGRSRRFVHKASIDFQYKHNGVILLFIV